MEEWLNALEKAFDDYGTEFDNAAKKQKITDGLFGFGRPLKDDACHDRLDERVGEAVRGICALRPGSREAERAVRLLLSSREDRFPHEAARWMLRAVERHAVALIPFLTAGAAAELLKEYTGRYRPWDRLPAQKDVCRALKAQAQRKRDAD